LAIDGLVGTGYWMLDESNAECGMRISLPFSRNPDSFSIRIPHSEIGLPEGG